MEKLQSLAPWLSVRDSMRAVDFYNSAFRAIEVHRLEAPDGCLVVNSIDGAEFYKYEMQRKRICKPNLSKFKLNYEHRDPDDNRPSIKIADN